MNGSTAATYDYDSWGNPIAENVYNVDVANQPIRYAGYYWDKETSLYYLMARYYHPKHGVFLSIDPELDSDESVSMSNGYSYADNSPSLKVDPDGEWAWAVAWGAYGGYNGYRTAQRRGYTGWKKWGYVGYRAGYEATGFGKIRRGYRVARSLYSFSKRPANLSPKGAGRRGAFRAAKRKMGIPMSQHPTYHPTPAINKQNKRIPGRDYDFSPPGARNKNKKVIRHHAGGHKYKDDPSQNRGRHYNDQWGGHYDYSRKWRR